MDKKTDALITQLLKKKNILSDEKVIQACFKEAEKKQCSPIPLLAKHSEFSEAELLDVIAQEFHIDRLDLKTTLIDKAPIQKVPVKIASYYKFVPIKLEDYILTIAAPYPLDVKKQDEIRTHLGYNIKIALSCEEDVLEMIKKHYGLGAATVEKIMAQKTYAGIEVPTKEGPTVEDLDALTEGAGASVIELVNQIILEAYKKRATDIHIEPYRRKIRLRYRIDGIFYDGNIS